MRRVAAVTVGAVLALGGVAAAQLSKADGRLTAETTAYSYFSRSGWTSEVKISACKRQSKNRIRCRGKATGDEFKGCEVVETSGYAGIECRGVFHTCFFKVAVHKAGYGALGRVQGVECSTEEHQE